MEKEFITYRLDALDADRKAFEKEVRDEFKFQDQKVQEILSHFDEKFQDRLMEFNGQLCELKAESVAKSVRSTIIIALLGIIATSLLIKVILG
jgi:uncharacterized protein YwqG